ncbi:hypothetical protein KCU67_g1987, partial [Aureobasidium melanogenum]
MATHVSMPQSQQQSITSFDHNAFVSEVEDSLLVAHDWAKLLSAAPLALGCVGECMNVAASPVAASIILQPPAKGFQHLKWKTLQANLLALTDEGRLAFIFAQKKMNHIAVIAKQICSDDGEVQDIIRSLQTRQATREMLPVTMEQLRLSVNDCKESAKNIEARFDTWLEIANELSEAATESKGNAHEQVLDTEQNLASEKIVIEAVQEEKNRNEAAVKEAERQMLQAEEALEMAASNIPSGWDPIAKKFVEAMTQHIIHIAANPTQFWLGGIIPVMERLSHTGQNEAPREPENAPSVRSHDIFELARQLAQLEMLVSCIADLIGGPQGPKWEQIYETSDVGPGTVTWTRALLSNLPTESAADAGIHANLMTKSVLDEMNQASKDRKTLGHSSISEDTQQAMRWNERIAGIRANMTLLRKDEAGSTSRSNAKSTEQSAASTSSIAEIEFRAAATRYETAQRCLDSQRTLYNQRTNDLAAQHVKISKIKDRMSRLQIGKLRLADIIQILKASITALKGLKAKMTELVEYFSNVSELIDGQAGRHANLLLATLKQENAKLTIDGHSHQPTGMVLSEPLRQLVLRNACRVQANFMVIKETAELYTMVSRKHIIPGVNLVEELGMAHDPGDTQQAIMTARCQRLLGYQQTAINDIRKMADKKRAKVLGRIEARQKSLQKTLDMLPPAPNAAAIKKAVEEATQATMSDYSKDDVFIDKVLEQTNEINFHDGDDFSEFQ